jgi:hypothetical protein
MLHTNEPEHGQRIARRAGCQYSPDQESVISRTDGQGKLLGGVIYSGFTGASIFAHIAGFEPNWMSRGFLYAAFYYPFVQLRVSKVFGWIPSSNLKALEFNRKLGFNTITTVPGVFLSSDERGGDAIIMGMAADKCRWLSTKPRTLA